MSKRRRFDLGQLREMLERLDSERMNAEKVLAPFTRQSLTDFTTSLVNRSVQDLMDRYDIRERVAGSEWRDHESGGLSIKVPLPSWQDMGYNISSLPPTFYSMSADTASPPTYGCIDRGSPFDNQAPSAETAEEAAKRRAEQEKAELRRRESARVTFLMRMENVGAREAKLYKNPNPEPPAAPRIPDYTHTLTGWRAWDVQDGMLDALAWRSPWRARKAAAATCRADDHSAPQMGCDCGYWSFKTKEKMIATFAESGRDRHPAVFGPVEIWGRVIEHEHGYRSEFAYPKELWLLKPGLESLSWTYGVPVKQL